MSAELDNFQRAVKKAQLLILSLNSLDAIEQDLVKELDQLKVKDPNSPFANHQFDDVREEFVESVLTSQIALLQAALEAYSLNVNGKRDGSSSCIQTHASMFRMRVDPTSTEYHVTEIVKDLRDRDLHSLKDYNVIGTKLNPIEVLTQRIIVVRYPDKKVVHILNPGENIADYLRLRLEKMKTDRRYAPTSEQTTSVMRYIDLLMEELDECLKIHDGMRDSNGGFRRKVMKSSEYVPIEYE